MRKTISVWDNRSRLCSRAKLETQSFLDKWPQHYPCLPGAFTLFFLLAQLEWPWSELGQEKKRTHCKVHYSTVTNIQEKSTIHFSIHFFGIARVLVYFQPGWWDWKVKRNNFLNLINLEYKEGSFFIFFWPVLL